METTPLKAFAMKARTDLIKAVSARAGVVLAENSLARLESASSVQALEKAIENYGLEQVIDRVAYTWFNRIIALRFMDANGYTSISIVSPAAGKVSGQPEVLAEAKAGSFDSEVVSQNTQDLITSLLNGSRQSQDPQGEAYGLLLEAYCQNLNKVMPFMFEREGDYTELLLPPALLSEGSVRDRAVATLTSEVCSEVEVIGWLYQFYISERKDEVFEGFKKNKKAGADEIPAATQLFTPHWIVRYLVENSLGRLWLLNNPSSKLAEKMDYYIQPIDEETEFLKITKPEELKIIDPAVGSGHMLTYAFDLLYEIYSDKGYDPSDVPGLILEHNLFGTEIDPRAGALAAFALTMKAAAKRKLFLKKPVQPNICVLENIEFDQFELDYLWKLQSDGDISREDSDTYWNAFTNADVFGALIQPIDELIQPQLRSITKATDNADLVNFLTLSKASKVNTQAEYLSQRYSLVTANPPYMGTRNMDSTLRSFAEDTYTDYSDDLCTMFLAKGLLLIKDLGYSAVVVSESWLFNSSYKNLRQDLLEISRPMITAWFDKSAFGVRLNTAGTVFKKRSEENVLQFFRVTLDDLSKGTPEALPPQNAEIYAVDIRQFETIPDCPFIFDMPGALLALYEKYPTVGDRFSPKQGLATADNARFVRFWWEVSQEKINSQAENLKDAEASGKKWFPYNKGGTPAPWWGNQQNVVNWENDGREIRGFGTESGGKPRSATRNVEYYFREAVTWSNIGSGGARFRYIPLGYIFDVAGMSVFATSEKEQLNLLGYLNSSIVRKGLDLLAPTLNYQVGDVARLPVLVDGDDENRVRDLILKSRAESSESENSNEFLSLPVLTNDESSLISALQKVQENYSDRAEEIRSLEMQSDEYWTSRIASSANTELTTIKIDPPRATEAFSYSDSCISLISYAVGAIFGRYSLDKPGLILADQGDSLQNYLQKVPQPNFLPDADNVIPIVDGDWFEDDIVSLFRQFLRASFGEEHFEENLRFIADSIGVNDIREYFVKSFYADHVKRYKKRPIYWLFSSPKGSFNALIYLHRYTPSTASTVLTGYLREYIGKLEANLEHLGRVSAGIGGATPREKAAAEKESDRILKVLVELREYERDVLFPLAGKQINLDLDDGVLVNYQKLGPALKDIGLKKVSIDE